MKTTSNYQSFVLATNATLKNEYKNLSGAVKMLVNMENLPAEVAKALRIIANNGSKAITTASSRHNIVVNITAFAKGENTAILRKATKAEIAKGASEYVEKMTFSPFWVLQQVYKMSK
jgi:hypothetical protein